MAILGDIFTNGMKGNLLSGLAIGVGAAILAPVVIPLVASIAKPLAKGVLKGGILVYEKGREVVSEVTEVVEDLAAEAKSELGKKGASSAEEMVQEVGKSA
jgi:polyhydroxyalkanoate synthesis regulator phasin